MFKAHFAFLAAYGSCPSPVAPSVVSVEGKASAVRALMSGHYAEGGPLHLSSRSKLLSLFKEANIAGLKASLQRY